MESASTVQVGNGSSHSWTLGDLVHSMLGDDHSLPVWPADAFAVAATILSETGAYVCATEKGSHRGVGCWEHEARQIGEGWATSGAKASHPGILKALVPPEEVYKAWSVLLSEKDLPLAQVIDNTRLCMALVDVLCYSDQAAKGFGISEGPGVRNAALVQLREHKGESLTARVNTDRAHVLPKQHVPQNGLTLRSLSHNLALIRPRGVHVRWVAPVHVFGELSEQEIVNILLLPWPEEVTEENFTLYPSPPNHVLRGGSNHRFFVYGSALSQEVPAIEAFRERLKTIVLRAKRVCGTFHIAVFPELALSEEQFTAAKQISQEHGFALVAGLRDFERRPANLCVTDLSGFMVQALSEFGQKNEKIRRELSQFLSHGSDVGKFLQFKHHRWNLNRSQIIQYGLGSRLPVSKQCWEWTPIKRRTLDFFTIDNWLTWTTLICEDLARQDPVAEIVRSVGPNLVIALLMDGPQLPFRWPARYATVLVDDPGASVLTLTSIGMAMRSTPNDGHESKSRTVALWRDAITGIREIELPTGASGLVLSLSPERREEWTADGRGDGGVAFTPVFAGVTPVSAH